MNPNHPEDQKRKKYRDLIDIAHNNIFDFHFFTKGEHNIECDYDQCNHILQILDQTQKGQYVDLEKAPQYNPNRKNKVPIKEMRSKIEIIEKNSNNNTNANNNNSQATDLSNLFQGKQDISSKDFYNFMKANDIQEYDPMQEALQYFVSDQNMLDTDKLQQTLEDFGFGKLDKKELEILIEVLAGGKDKPITLQTLQDIFNQETFDFINSESESKYEYKKK